MTLLLALTFGLNAMFPLLLAAELLGLEGRPGWVSALIGALVIVTPIVTIVTFGLRTRRTGLGGSYRRAVVRTWLVPLLNLLVVGLAIGGPGAMREEDLWMAWLFYLLIIVVPIVSVVTLVVELRRERRA